MNRQEAFIEINRIQDEYVNELIGLIKSPDCESMKKINFTSPTGTGKTKMMSKLINKMPEFYFVITTLSKGQLHIQTRNSLTMDCQKNNFIVYGSADYRINSKLDAEDIISQIPDNTECIWIRDEGHIKTNRFDELLSKRCFKVVNFSATNITSDIKCNFTQTMMLRTVNQDCGTPDKAIEKLMEIKEIHKNVPNYNPCAIFRCVAGDSRLYNRIIELCKKHKLKYLDLNDDPYIMAMLCEDDNETDVIINKFKITEGIDIRRAHVLYMDNQPTNNTTTIQVIGRCRRNALLYREDIDILAPENKELLSETRQCFVYYNVDSMHIDEDPNGELQYAFCDKISCEELKPDSIIHVDNGQLANGLHILELEGETGDFEITVDKETGFNIINPINNFYETKEEEKVNYFYFKEFNEDRQYVTKDRFTVFKVAADDIKKFPLVKSDYFDLLERELEDKAKNNADFNVSPEDINLFMELSYKYTRPFITSKIIGKDIESKLEHISFDIKKIKKCLNESLDFYNKNYDTPRLKTLSRSVLYLIESNEAGSICLYTNFSKNEIILIKYFYLKKIDELRQKNKVSEVDNIINGSKKGSYQEFVTTLIKNRKLYEDNPNFEKITYYILANDINKVFIGHHPKLKMLYKYPDSIELKMAIKEYFNNIDEHLDKKLDKGTCYLSHLKYFKLLHDSIQDTLENLKKGKVDRVQYDYSALRHDVTEEEEYLVTKKFYKSTYGYYITEDEIDEKLKEFRKPYVKIVNDKESAIIGVDLMRPIKSMDGDVIWAESKTVSSKVGGYNKFNRFISQRYEKELKIGKEQLFTGKNNFPFDKKCNSMVGYCVEYYSKYLLYGKDYLKGYLYYEDYYTKRPENEIRYLIVRACMLKYKELMVECYGMGVSKFIKITSEEQLLSGKYDEFVDVVTTLGERTAKFVKNALYANRTPENNIDPNLSIEHISGLADYITEDAILDVKVRNNIDDKCIRQVLAYHYLSTKRSDLHIKKVFIYDATSDRAVVINIDEENQV